MKSRRKYDAVPDEPASGQHVQNASYICLILKNVLNRTANGTNMLYILEQKCKHVKATGDYDGVESKEEMFIHVFTPIISTGSLCTCFGTFYHWSISRCNEK